VIVWPLKGDMEKKGNRRVEFRQTWGQPGSIRIAENLGGVPARGKEEKKGKVATKWDKQWLGGRGA